VRVAVFLAHFKGLGGILATNQGGQTKVVTISPFARLIFFEI
jgi:hypothetical protein